MSDWQRCTCHGRHSNLTQCIQVCALADWCAHYDGILLTTCILEGARGHACDRQSDRAIELCGRYAEQTRFLRVHIQAQVRTGHFQWIQDIARARRFFNQRLDLRRQLLDDFQVSTDEAHGNRRGDWRAVDELFYVDARTRVPVEFRAQFIQALRSGTGVVIVQLHEHFGVVR